MAIRLSGSNEEVSASMVLVVVGLICLGLGGSRFLESRASASWPFTEGQVVVSEVTTTHGGRHNTTIYNFRLKYEYNVASTLFLGNRISFDPQVSTSCPEDAESLAAQFPLRSSLRVYYDPAHPGWSVLQPGMVASGIPLALFGLLLTGAGLAMLALWFNAEPPRRAEPDPFAAKPQFWPDAFVK